MIKNLHRITAMLLVLVLLTAMMPTALAAETETVAPSGEATEPPTETVPEESTIPETPPETEETQTPTEATVPEATETIPPSEETDPPAEETDSPPGETSPEEIPELPSNDESEINTGMDMPNEAVSDDIDAYATSGSIYLFDLASPNYTITLNSQVTVKYKPNGTGSSVTAYLKNLGWHYAQYGGVAYFDDPIYCIEPHKNFAASTPGNYMDTDIPTSGGSGGRGTDVWNAMPRSYRNAIALVLAYSDQMWDWSYSVKTTSRDNNPNTPLHLATQFLIYEIAMGIRNADTFDADGNGYVSGDILYNAGCQVSGFASNYNSLVEKVRGAMKLPSFVSSSSSSAPTIDLNGDLTTVTDYNGVLSYFSFPDGSGASFSKYGDTLYIEQVGDIPANKVFNCYRNVPSGANSTVALYYGGASTYQTCVKLHSPSSENLYGYFKLNAPPTTGSLSLTKTTEDGKNLSGWRFGIYSDSACTSLVSGPYATDGQGKISVSGLTAGTFWVKELGHQDAAVNALYTCASENPQKVTISPGDTATVSFHNKLAMGYITFQKTTNTGNHLGGWTFRVRDSSGQTVGDYVTDETGHATAGPLPLGKYLVQELPTGDDYWQVELTFHDVVVEAGKTTVDKWHNVEQGLAQFHKATNTGGSLEGWQITVYADAACTQEIITLTTTEQGYTGYFMDPGTYWAKETGDTLGRFEDEYWTIDPSVQEFTVEPHKDTAVYFTNTHFGKLRIVKKMATDGPLAGWQFKVTDTDGNEVEGSPFTSLEDGTILTGKLLPGNYTVEEILPDDTLYYCKSENPQTITVKPGETTEVSFTNALRPGKITVQKVDLRGQPLAGATFRLEWSQYGELWEPVHFSDKEDVELGGCNSPGLEDGRLTSGEDGILEWANLYPGIQYRVTEVEAPEGYVLLTKPAYQGTLSAEKLEVSLRVVNCPGFTLPETGSFAAPVLRAAQLVCLITCAAMLCWSFRKEKQV